MRKNIIINNKYGELSARVIKREDSDFPNIFTNYSHFIVLDWIKSSKKNKGYGNILINDLLSLVEKNNIILLTVCPALGDESHNLNLSEEDISSKLESFYRTNCFRKYPKAKTLMYRKT